MADGYIDIDVRLNDKPAQGQAEQIGQSLGRQVSNAVDNASQGAQKSTRQALDEIGGTLESFGSKYSKAVTLPIAAAAAASGAAAVKIDTALTGVRKTVDGTEQQYEQLKDAAIEFSKTNAVDPAQILDIQALGAQLGYSIDELDEFGEVVSGLDIATNMNAEEAATQLAQFANIMGMSHDETKNFGSTIVDLGNNFATTEADIANMSMRIAGAGKQIGMSEADVLGLATALASMGINAEAGGSAISTIMSKIDKDVALGTDNLELWASTANMSVDEFSRAWGEDAVGALSAVLVGMDAATQQGGNMAVMLDELGISEIRQTDTLKRLASNSEFLGRAVDTANTAWEENIALDKEVENRNNSMAAKMQILFNKVQAVAIEVGEPLMDALMDIIDAADPLIDALASGAQAFADLDEDGQRAILTVLAIVAAFGPMVGIVGKVTTGLTGSVNAWRGFRENLNAVKTSLASSTTELNKQAAAQSKYKTILLGGQQATVKYNAETKKMQVVQSANTTTTKAQTAAMKASTVATKAQTVAMSAMTTAGRALKSALATIAPILAITAAIEIFMQLSAAISDSQAKAENFKKATDGITGAMDSYSSAYDKARSSMDSAAKGAENYSHSLAEIQQETDESIAKTAELADAIADSFSEVGTNSAMVDSYADTIQNLTNKYDENGTKAQLSAQEQGELIAAVDGLNSIMGTSYDVIDAQNGILNVNTDEILKSADAWKKRALMEAQSQAAADIVKRQAENVTALRHAEETLTTTQEKLAQAQANGEQDLTHYRLGVEQAQAKVDELTQVQDGLDQEYNDLTTSIATLNSELNSSSDSLKSYIGSTEQWSKALENSGVNADDFVKKLSEIGVSTEDLSRIMEEQGDEGIQSFIKAYQEGGDSLNNWVRDTLGKNLEDSAQQAASKTGEGVLAGLSSQEKQIINAISGIVGVSNEEFMKMANGAQLSGQQAISALALAIADGSVNAQSSADEVKNAVNTKLSEMNGEIPAGEVIRQITDTYNGRVGETQEAAQNVTNTDQAELNKIDGKTPAHRSMSEWTAELQAAVPGSKLGSKANTDAANTELDKLDAENIANQEMSGWVSGIENTKGQSRRKANLNSNAARDGLKQYNDNSWGWGNSLGQNFANGIRNAVSASSSAAKAVANAAKAVLGHSVPKEGPLHEGGKGEAIWGQHFVENFARGMLSSRRKVTTAAEDVAQDITDVFSSIGTVTNDGIIMRVAFEDPNIRISDSMLKGVAALNLAAYSGGGMNTYNNSNQTINFNGEVNSPDIIARNMRLQEIYGLAGRFM